MFMVDNAAKAAIQKAYHEHGEAAAVSEMKRLFPGLSDEQLHNSVRIVASWPSDAVDLEARVEAARARNRERRHPRSARS